MRQPFKGFSCDLVDLEPAWPYEVPQILDSICEEIALGDLKCNTGFPERLKYSFHVPEMVFVVLRKDDDVVEINETRLPLIGA